MSARIRELVAEIRRERCDRALERLGIRNRVLTRELPDAYRDPAVRARQEAAVTRGTIYRRAVGTILRVR
jgi:hypothetical protein